MSHAESKRGGRPLPRLARVEKVEASIDEARLIGNAFDQLIAAIALPVLRPEKQHAQTGEIHHEQTGNHLKVSL